MVEIAAVQGWASNRARFSAAITASRCRHGCPVVSARGMEMLPEDQRDDHAGGLILAFEVDDPNGVIIELLDWKAAAG